MTQTSTSTADDTAPERRRRVALPAPAPVAIAVLALAAYVVLGLARWHRGAAPSWDLAIFTQAVRGYAGFGAPVVDLKGPGFIQLGDHFSPLLVVLAPFYRLFPSPVTLVVAQAVLLAVSVWAIASLARRRLGEVAGLCVGLAYAASWGVQSAADVQFHEVALGAPLLALGLRSYLLGRPRTAAVWICLLLGVKEDLGLTVAAFGLVLAMRGERRLGAWVAGIGVAGMALVVAVLVPLANPDGAFAYWGVLTGDASAGVQGPSGASGVGEAVRGVLDAVGHLLTPSTKLATLGMLAVVTLGAALASPIALLLVPTLLWRFMSANSYYWGTDWHYSLVLMPIVFAAGVDTIARLRERQAAHAEPEAASAGQVGASGRFARPLRWYAAAAPAGMLVVAAVVLPRFPLGTLTDPATYETGPRAEAVRQVLALIPDGSLVETDTGLMNQLVSRTTLYWVGRSTNPAPDALVIDAWSGWGGNAPADAAAYAEQLHPGTSYRLAYDDAGYQVALRA